MRIKKIATNGITFFLMMWISANYAQKSNTEKKANIATKKEKFLAIEKACQTIIDEKYNNNIVANLSNTDNSISTSDVNLLEVLGDISSELQNNINTKTEITEYKNQLNKAQTFNDVYPNEKYEALIAHGNDFIKKAELLSQTLHKKGNDLEVALKMNKLVEENGLIKKMGLAFHAMGFRLDSAIMDVRKTQPYLVEAYTKLNAIGDELTATENLESSIVATKSLYGIILYLSAIKNCNATLSKIQDDLAFLAKIARTQ
ncbi:hypothetical protein [Flavobacterium sp.]|uniref:hypothetical protein n=1 Tax=Flavobacterium sp. TaxID=239 RepID=UPI002B9D4C74|nr:hypothetical protein [Flavobacterium sp.]HSD08059.1 hypothetical protein [Flavobacterium sp.]